MIAIGDELTTGQRLDTNSQWLSQRLTEMGVSVAYHTTIGDELDDNINAFRAAIERADVVVITGGLGPTADDLTREALAAAVNVELVRDEPSLRRIEQLFQSRGRTMPSRNVVQADFPKGAVPITNPHGTAPGIELHVPREGRTACLLFALPGVPAEMYEMWEATVTPQIAKLQPEPRVIRHRRIKCFGVGESQLEAMLPDLIRRDREPRVGITVSDAVITLRITAAEKDEATCFAAMAPTEATIREALGNLVYGQEDDELEDVVVRALQAKGLTIAVAEWATEGLVGEWLKRASGNSGVFLASSVVDSLQQIPSLPADSEPNGSATATALAEGVRQTTSADIGLGIAAFPAIRDTADAHVCAAIALPERTRKLRFRCASHPSIMRTRTARQALNAVRLALLSGFDTT
ncbi:MAG: CinA family nicotinamide mononucleotide deamidase-related protein [Planctomycetales bacterium]|nr:CinA family nicotinamide mononucleotide deamidase-related protein [Planctomycetales bacterium]